MKKSTIKMLILAMVISFGSTIIPIKADVNIDNNVRAQYDLVKLDRNNGNASEGNLITDSGFENSSNGTWRKTGNGSFSNYPGAAANGEYFGLLPANSGNASIYQVVNVESNTEYVARAKVLVAREGASAFLNVKTPDVSTLIGDAETTITWTADKDWQYQDVELRFNSGNNSSIALCVMKWTEDQNSATFKGQVYVDDVYLEKINVGDDNGDDNGDENYEIIWADDFNDQKLDLSSWEYELGSIRGIEQQHYVNDPENVFVRDNGEGGELVLKATDRPEELQYNNPRNASREVIYNSGSVRTHGKVEFLYGRLEMRAKLPKGQSVFPAFWTLGSDFTIDGDISNEQGYGWARCGEIDIMELIGSNEGGNGNKIVYQTLHTSDGNDGVDHKLAGVSYKISEDFADDYHIFGINWSKGKMEWYVDDQIVKIVDYSNDPVASKCLDRPQYIQMNLAMGGAWPGEIQEGLDGTEYAIDYVYYAQNEQQKLDSEQYYEDSPKILIYDKDITIYEGDTDVLSNVIVSDNADIDFSITDAPKFSNKEEAATTETALTSVDLLSTGKDDLGSLANLPAGEYSLYYTALPKNMILDENNIPDAEENYKFDRKAANLTIKERSLETDLQNSNLSLSGYVNDTLETIELPAGWSWDVPETVITEDMGEVSITFSKNGFEKTEEVKINTYVSVTLEDLSKIIEEANIYLNKTDMYTNETLTNLKKVADNANIILNMKPSATYREITKAYEDVVASIESLVEIDTEDNNQGGNQEDNNQSGNQENNNQGGNQDESVTIQGKNSSTTNKLPNTGGSNPIYLLLCAGATLGIGGILTLKRK